MSTMMTWASRKLAKRRKKITQKLISFARRTPSVAMRFSEWRNAQALRSPDTWLTATQAKLAHMRLPDFPEDTNLVLAPEFPPSAWQLHLSDGINKIRHGLGVQTKDGSVFEGVWNGPFAAFDFRNADYVFGSGITQHQGLTITPPTHMFECVFFFQNTDTKEFFASNSLACCIAALPEEERAPWLVKLAKTISEINNKQTKSGFFGYDTKIMQIAQWELHCIFAHNLDLTPSAPINVTLRTNLASFDDFAGYETYVTSVLRGVIANGQSPLRKTASLSPVTCISTGYDSTAVTALGKSVGIDDALTLDITVNGVNDCGDAVAKELGVSCRSFVHPAGQTIDHLHMYYSGDVRNIAAEFIGTVGFGDDILYAAFESVLNGKMLFDGKAGDDVWAIDYVGKEGLPISAPYSKSLNEFRLRVGFAHIPTPVIGADFPEAIARISRSDEMKRYSIGGGYDRPIPRRLAEAAGASRDSFGQDKKAANPHPLNLDELKHNALCDMVNRYVIT